MLTWQKTAVIILLLAVCMISFNQTEERIFDEIPYKEGLNPPNIIFQDSKGFMWFGSNSNLQRYDGYVHVNYDRINVSVNDICEDTRGILWLATVNGIYLLNPENEKILHFMPYTSNNTIYQIIEDSKGLIWCGTFNGLLRIEPKQKGGNSLKEIIFKEGMEAAFHISNILVNKKDNTLGENRINQVMEDSEGRLWAGGVPGLFILTSETSEFVRIDDDDRGHTRLEQQQVYGIEGVNPDVIWVQTTSGFTRISNIMDVLNDTVIDKSELDFNGYPRGSNTGLTSSFKIDSRNNIWIGGQQLFKTIIDENLMGTFENVYPETTSTRENPFGFVNSIMEDRTGLLWVGHRKIGIRRFREGYDLFTRMDAMLDGYNLANYDFPGIYEDADGNLWICNYGDGLFKISKNGEVSNYNTEDHTFQDELGNYTQSILEIEKGLMWIGVRSGIRQLDARTEKIQSLTTLFPGEHINPGENEMRMIENFIVIRTISQGLWLVDLKSHTIKKYMTRQNDSPGLGSNYVTSISEIKNDDFWVNTAPPELNRIRLDKTKGELVFLSLPEAIDKNRQRIIDDSRLIYQIYEDDNGTFWFGRQNGLIKLDTLSGEIRIWTEADGLSDNDVRFMEVDNNGNMWLGTRDGLSVLDLESGIIKTFDEGDGWPDITHEHMAHFKNNQGLIYVGGIGGFYRIDPDKLFSNDMIPPVMITEFRLFNESIQVDSGKKVILTNNIAYTHEMDLAYNQNDLSFTFAVLDYNDPAKNKYAYILEGYQDEWIETGADNRIATYTNMSPGKYVFRVIGSNNDGIWNEEGTFITIRIHPPFYKTTLAYIIYGVLFVLLLWGVIYWRTWRLRKEKIVLEKQVSERTADLKQANINLEKNQEELQEANTLLKEQQEKLKSTNTQLKEHQDELQEVNVLLEEQKEELMQQKEELQSTLENLQKTQEQLVESEKMAALGGLVAGVAHEINTPVGIGITAITSMMEEVQKIGEMFREDQISRKDFQEFLQSNQEAGELIQKNLQRTASLVQSFKQVSADQVSEQQREFYLREYLHDILMSLQPKLRNKKIDFSIECDEKLKLNSYPGVFAQIFTNLILNSLQHGFSEKDTGMIGIKAEKSKEILKIQYLDNGSGISKTDLPHIFEPFYTSDQHRGTGLGLNIVYNLIRQKLNGTITCESEQGKGAMFTILVQFRT